jgi:hypothetical protein
VLAAAVRGELAAVWWLLFIQHWAVCHSVTVQC